LPSNEKMQCWIGRCRGKNGAPRDTADARDWRKNRTVFLFSPFFLGVETGAPRSC
jgi:hypothetical protein